MIFKFWTASEGLDRKFRAHGLGVEGFGIGTVQCTTRDIHSKNLENVLQGSL